MAVSPDGWATFTDAEALVLALTDTSTLTMAERPALAADIERRAAQYESQALSMRQAAAYLRGGGG